MAGQYIARTFRSYGVKLADQVYNASFWTIVAYSGLLVLQALVGVAVTIGAVHVPQFHPR